MYTPIKKCDTNTAIGYVRSAGQKNSCFLVKDDNTVLAKEIKIQNEMPHMYIVSAGINPSDKNSGRRNKKRLRMEIK
jgi:hypothetical protein